MKRPASLLAVAALFLLVGLYALWDMATGTSRDGLTLNFGVVGLAIGPGLLSLRPAWRRAALACLGIAVAVVAFAALLLMFAGNVRIDLLGRVVDGSAHRPIGLLAAAGAVAVIAWAWAVLAREDIRRLFVAAS